MCWQLYPISPPPDDLCHDLIQGESHSAQDYGWRPALMALLQELSLYYMRRHQTERLHAHKHILAQHDTFADSPDHIIKTYSFSSDEMSYAAGVAKILQVSGDHFMQNIVLYSVILSPVLSLWCFGSSAIQSKHLFLQSFSHNISQTSWCLTFIYSIFFF